MEATKAHPTISDRFLTHLEVSPAAPNMLHVPATIREYVNEKGEGRSFNLEAFSIRRITAPDYVLIDLLITNKGAELLEPFTARIVLGGLAAQQLVRGLGEALSRDGVPEHDSTSENLDAVPH